MAENSAIEWTTSTFNPWRGCTKVSAGCANCYAETLSGRNPGTLGVWGPNGTRVVASEAMWKEPVKWDRMARDGVCYHCHGKSTRDTPGKCPVCDGKGNIGPHRSRVFCASLADVFEDWQGPMADSKGERLYWPNNSWNARRPWVPVSDCGGDEKPITMQDVRARLFRLIDATPNLDWLLLTKRPENVGLMAANFWGLVHPEYPQNVWLGTSVENQQAADERIPHLLRVPAAVRFLSCEPLLGQVILHKYLAQCECGHGHGFTACPNTGGVAQTCHQCDCRKLRPKLHWVIAGGESGPGARPCNVAWIRSIVEQCKAAGVACFVKQMGAELRMWFSEWRDKWMPLTDKHGFTLGAPHTEHGLWRGIDKKGGDPAEWPADLRVRQFPEAKGAVPA